MTVPLDVVVTGMGVVSPIGIGTETFWQSLLDQKTGVCVRPEHAHTQSPWRIGAPVRDFDAKLYVKPRKSLKVMCPQIQFGYAAAQLAADQAGLTPGSFDPDRVGTMFGSETFYADPMDVAAVFRQCVINGKYDHERWGEFSMKEIMPLWMLKYLPNMVASHVSIAFDARGPSNTICQAEVSGALALIEAIDILRRGGTDVVIVGGTGSPMETTSLLYRGWHGLSRRIHDPAAASRPFDADRDGPVLGEGAAAVILERGEYAKARGATILARIVGYNRRFVLPDSDAFSSAVGDSIRQSLRQADMPASAVSHVSANALSAVREDMIEAQAIRNTLGDVPVLALKSYVGNVGPGANVLELIASIQARRQGILPGTLNYEKPDPRCPINVQRQAQKIAAGEPGVLVSLATTGQIATIVAA